MGYLKRHADLCGCADRKKSCSDVPKLHRMLKASGWRWDGTGDNGLWAVGLMSTGRYFCMMNGTGAWEVIDKVCDGSVLACSVPYRIEQIFDGDELVHSIERKGKK